MTTPRGFPSWDELYRAQAVETMPWFYPHMDPDLAAALDRLGVTSGRALDLGTGPGTQAIALAKRGFRATGIDLSPAAVESAARRAAGESVDVRFVQHDILAGPLDQSFDLVFDRGCFHVLDPERRAEYRDRVHRMIEPLGHLFLKTFSVKQRGEFGPHRFAPEDIRAIFEPVFDVESVVETIYHGPLDPPPIALFSVLRRR